MQAEIQIRFILPYGCQSLKIRAGDHYASCLDHSHFHGIQSAIRLILMNTDIICMQNDNDIIIRIAQSGGKSRSIPFDTYYGLPSDKEL
jgi:hypothetical protein